MRQRLLYFISILGGVPENYEIVSSMAFASTNRRVVKEKLQEIADNFGDGNDWIDWLGEYAFIAFQSKDIPDGRIYEDTYRLIYRVESKTFLDD